MVSCALLLTNNPAFFAEKRDRLEVLPVQGTAHAVLCAARDKVHLGWRLLNHPLYGNYRPYQQPFRTLLLAAPAPGAGVTVDEESLSFMEQAFGVYESCAGRWATSDNVPEAMLADCSFIDKELMRATLDSLA